MNFSLDKPLKVLLTMGSNNQFYRIEKPDFRLKLQLRLQLRFRMQILCLSRRMPQINCHLKVAKRFIILNCSVIPSIFTNTPVCVMHIIGENEAKVFSSHPYYAKMPSKTPPKAVSLI